MDNDATWQRTMLPPHLARQSKKFTSIEQPRGSQYIYWIRSAGLSLGASSFFFDGRSCFYNIQYCPIIFSDANQEQLTSPFSPPAVIVIPSRHQLQSKEITSPLERRATANYPVSSWCALVILLFLAIRYLIFNRLTLFSNSSPQALISHRQEFCSSLERQPIPSKCLMCAIMLVIRSLFFVIWYLIHLSPSFRNCRSPSGHQLQSKRNHFCPWATANLPVRALFRFAMIVFSPFNIQSSHNIWVYIAIRGGGLSLS